MPMTGVQSMCNSENSLCITLQCDDYKWIVLDSRSGRIESRCPANYCDRMTEAAARWRGLQAIRSCQSVWTQMFHLRKCRGRCAGWVIAFLEGKNSIQLEPAEDGQ